MAGNRFKDHIKTEKKAAKIDAKRSAEVLKYLRKLSLDHKGTPLKTLLIEDETKAAQEFIAVMAKSGFPGSDKLKLESRMPKRPLERDDMANGSDDYRVSKRITNLLRWRSIWSGQGYLVGVITKHEVASPEISSVSLVYLCTDLKLRCIRSEPIFKPSQSYASGYGTLPDSAKFSFVFTPGFFVDSSYEPKQKIFEKQDFRDLLTYIVSSHLI